MPRRFGAALVLLLLLGAGVLLLNTRDRRAARSPGAGSPDGGTDTERPGSATAHPLSDEPGHTARGRSDKDVPRVDVGYLQLRHAMSAFGGLPLPWRVQGQVLDEAGQPVAGARVRVVRLHGLDDPGLPGSRRQTLSEALSDETGNFAADATYETSNLYVTAEAAGYGQATFDLTETRHQGPKPVLVLPSETAEVTGLVLDEPRRTGLADAEVVYTFSENGSGGTVRTDEKGRFVLRGAPPGPVQIGVRTSNRVFTVQALKLRAGESAEVTLVLARGATVYGVVYGPNRKHVLGHARVRLGRWPRDVVECDAKGRFELSGIGTGGAWAYAWLRVEALGYQMKTVEFPEDRTEDRDGRFRLDVSLEPALVAHGKVVDAQGKAVAGAAVTVFDGRWADPPTVLTLTDGRFYIDDLAPDEPVPELWIRAAGFKRLEVEERSPDRPGPQVFDLGKFRLEKADD